MSTNSIYDLDLPRTSANFDALTPLTFLQRSVRTYPDHTAVVHGDLTYTYRQLADRCACLGSALSKAGVGKGDTVAVLAPNIPAHLEAHFGVAMTGAVLNAINTRLDAKAVAFILDHGEAKVLMVDTELAKVAGEALKLCDAKPLVVDIVDALGPKEPRLATVDYESFIAGGDPTYTGIMPADEWDAIALNYTSGTTGNPKGVVYHHRGAALNAIGNALAWEMPMHPVYLWTLPMFHCNGWCFPWTITAMAGTHVCLRKVDPALILTTIINRGVTHFNGAPTVLNMLVNAPSDLKIGLQKGIRVMTAGAAPPAAVMSAMEDMGFDVTHAYGLTETYGPATICAWHRDWNGKTLTERAVLKARQGVPYHVLAGLTVMNPETMEPTPADGQTMGEVMFRGNVVMKGYLKNPKATEEALRGGWFHSGDLGVMHPDGYIELKDRSKDIIISGGENISTIEVEGVLYQHPAVLEAAVVARPDAHWGETPCAFVTLKNGQSATEAELIAFCRANLAHFKAPKTIVFSELPKTSTGKIQKFVLRERAKTL
jgi:fatty-acyl-CoA synthase